MVFLREFQTVIADKVTAVVGLKTRTVFPDHESLYGLDLSVAEKTMLSLVYTCHCHVQ